MSMVYMNLQPPAETARRSPVAWWSLTHAFSPLPLPYPLFTEERRGGCFLLSGPAVTDCFYFQKWSALCCPDFPPVPFCKGTGGRPQQCFCAAKVRRSERKAKRKSHFLLLFRAKVPSATAKGTKMRRKSKRKNLFSFPSESARLCRFYQAKATKRTFGDSQRYEDAVNFQDRSAISWEGK